MYMLHYHTMINDEVLQHIRTSMLFEISRSDAVDSLLLPGMNACMFN